MCIASAKSEMQHRLHNGGEAKRNFRELQRPRIHIQSTFSFVGKAYKSFALVISKDLYQSRNRPNPLISCHEFTVAVVRNNLEERCPKDESG